MTEYECGVRDLAEYLIKLVLDDEHEGELNYEDVVCCAAGFGVVVAHMSAQPQRQEAR